MNKCFLARVNIFKANFLGSHIFRRLGKDIASLSAAGALLTKVFVTKIDLCSPSRHFYYYLTG